MCTFKAAELLAERRTEAEKLGQGTHQDSMAAYGRICQIDHERWEHEKTGCKCWDEARAATGQEVAA